MKRDDTFWRRLDELLERSEIVVDRPRGSRHPRFPETAEERDYIERFYNSWPDMGGMIVERE